MFSLLLQPSTQNNTTHTHTLPPTTKKHKKYLIVESVVCHSVSHTISLCSHIFTCKCSLQSFVWGLWLLWHHQYWILIKTLGVHILPTSWLILCLSPSNGRVLTFRKAPRLFLGRKVQSESEKVRAGSGVSQPAVRPGCWGSLILEYPGIAGSWEWSRGLQAGVRSRGKRSSGLSQQRLPLAGQKQSVSAEGPFLGDLAADL